MTISTKTKKALATIRKEAGFSQADMKTMLGDAVTLADIRDFENDKDSENDFLAICYFHIFHFIISERAELEEHIYEEPEEIESVKRNRINPFERNPFKVNK